MPTENSGSRPLPRPGRGIKLHQYGVGTVSVDNAFHYLWAAATCWTPPGRAISPTPTARPRSRRSCRSSASFRRSAPPHSWGFPPPPPVGFPIVIDWATSVVAMGRVQQLKREGKQLPPLAAVDKDGNPTTDPKPGRLAFAFWRPQGLRPLAHQRARRQLHRRSLAHIRNRWDQAAGDHCPFCSNRQLLEKDTSDIPSPKFFAGMNWQPENDGASVIFFRSSRIYLLDTAQQEASDKTGPCEWASKLYEFSTRPPTTRGESLRLRAPFCSGRRALPTCFIFSIWPRPECQGITSGNPGVGDGQGPWPDGIALFPVRPA